MARRLARAGQPDVLLGGGRIMESAIIETCNRLELYLVCSSAEEAARSAMEQLGRGTPSGSFYVKSGADAVRHLFRVASGLDSPVLGEEQILEQVREAGRTARTAGSAKSVLSSLFDAAYSSGRRIRASYEVSPENRSVSSFALKHALEEVGGRPASALLIGSGETAKLAALKLKGSTVYLLSARRGVESRFPKAVRIPRRRLREAAEKCDLIISATRRRRYVLTARDLPRAKKVVVLDLGFPRNVDPSVGDLKLVRLYDLDAVAEWALSRTPIRNAAAEASVEEETKRFAAWLTASRLTPTLASIYRWAESIREEEAVAALRKLPNLSAHDRGVVEALSRRLTGKLISPHAAFVKQLGSGEGQQERLLLLESIFRDGGKAAQKPKVGA